MDDVSLVHTSGGLIGDVITDSLRQPDVHGDAKFLADVATFTDRSGQPPTRAQYASDLDAAFRTGVALWSAYADELREGIWMYRVCATVSSSSCSTRRVPADVSTGPARRR